MFVTFKRSHDKYFAAINVDDIKSVTIHKQGKQIADVDMSNHELTLDVNEAQAQRFERELLNRYHVVSIGKSIGTQKNPKAYNTILKLEIDKTTTYVWPRGLSMIRVADNEIFITVHGQDEETSVTLDETPQATEVAEIFGLLHIV
jgi:hypothetical protein